MAFVGGKPPAGCVAPRGWAAPRSHLQPTRGSASPSRELIGCSHPKAALFGDTPSAHVLQVTTTLLRALPGKPRYPPRAVWGAVGCAGLRLPTSPCPGPGVAGRFKLARTHSDI